MKEADNPFQLESYSDTEDTLLVARVLEGDQESLTKLLERHQRFIFNVALKMTNHLQDAEDVTQEILIKLMTNLRAFDPTKGRFRTWLYRVTFNHILNIKQQKYETLVTSFELFFQAIDQSPTDEITLEDETEFKLFIDEARVTCMAGMIMCLAREQRLIYIVGEVFDIDHQLGAEIFNISPANFRKKLSRARQDLYQWMTGRCGLVNLANPCRCPKKTKGFIANGWVDPQSLKWHSNYQQTIAELSHNRIDDALSAVDEVYRRLYREQPFKEYSGTDELMATILTHPILNDLFSLDAD